MLLRPAAGLVLAVGLFLPLQTPPPRAQETPPPPSVQPPPPGLLPLQLLAQIDLEPGVRPLPAFLLEGGKLFLTTSSGELRAFDALTGALLWKLSREGAALLPPSSSPAGILAPQSDGALFLVDPGNGTVRREARVASSIGVLLPSADGGIYVAATDGTLSAWDSGVEKERWRFNVGEPIRALAEGAGLIVASGEAALTAVDRESGKLRWSFKPIGGRGGFEAPAVFDDTGERLYVGDLTGYFYALSARNGKERYHWPTGGAVTVPALVEKNRVYIASYANTLFCYAAGPGYELWRVDIPGRPAAAPVRAGSFIAVAALTGEIVEFNATTGKRGMTPPYRAAEDILRGPRLAPPQVALALISGQVVLLATGSPPPPPATTTTATEGETSTTTTTTTSSISSGSREPRPPTP